MNYFETDYQVDRGVALITMSRPSKLNAYTPDMGEELVGAFRAAFRDDEVMAIVLTGAGRGFCAGADRSYFQGKTAKCGQKLGEEFFLTGFVAELASSNKPLIAAVNGIASGIGATMTLPFDLRIGCDQTSFDFPFVRLGLSPGFGSSYYLPRLVGAGAAADVLLNSRRINAAVAYQLGLIQQIVPSEQLVATSVAMARQIGAAPSGIVGYCKQFLRNSPSDSLRDCVAREQCAAQELGSKSGVTSH